MSCKLQLKKLYTEPEEEYICISTSLYLPKEYARHLEGELRDIKEEKKQLFLKNMIHMAKILLERDDKYYLRIYFNSALCKDSDYIRLINMFRKHPKVQLVNYKDPDIELCTDHYGTIVRIHPLFDTGNMKMVCLMDADNFYTDALFKEIEQFEKDDNDVLAITRGMSCGNMYNVQPRNAKQVEKEVFQNHFLYGATMFKKNPELFTKNIWTDYFLNIYDNVGLKHVIMESDYKRFAFFPDTKEKSYLSYHYGTDEIVLNYVLKDVLEDLKIKYLNFSDESVMNYMLSRTILSLKFNRHKNPFASKKIPSLDKNDVAKSFELLKENIKYLKMMDIDICFINFIKDWKKWQDVCKHGKRLDYYLGQLD